MKKKSVQQKTPKKISPEKTSASSRAVLMKQLSGPKSRPPSRPGSRAIYRVGVVTARFNDEITSQLEAGAIEYLEELGADIFNIKVAGAVEIALAVQALFDHQNVDGVVALGAVIRGETTHYEEVCRSVERNCSRLILDYKKPVGFGVLTVENEEQARERIGGTHGHKGIEAAQAVVEMIGLLREIKKK